MEESKTFKAKDFKIGIACVYYMDFEHDWLFHLQQNAIKKFSSKYSVKIYASIVKVPEMIVDIMKSNLLYKVYDSVCDSKLPNRQHGNNLSSLVNNAFNDGCSHVITLDLDSFPCNSEWISSMISFAEDSGGVCAVVRNELGDSHLPHPCGLLITKQYFEKHGVDFYPNSEFFSSKRFKTFEKETSQRVDTGIGLSVDLWTNKINWYKLNRTNKNDLHYLMAGIYGGVIFHIGAISRGPLFAKCLERRLFGTIIKKLSKFPFLWRLENYYLEKIVKQNTETQSIIINRLKKDPFIFIDGL
jgi:hypothetical protein